MCCLNVVNGLCAQSIEKGLFGTLVALCGKLYHKYFYIGKKTKRFRDGLRKHITGLLYPHRVRPQPYMSLLTAHAGGYSISALARSTFVPIAQCSGNLDVFELEQHIINTEHQPLNEPYVSMQLAHIGSPQALRFHKVRKQLVVSARPSHHLAGFAHKGYHRNACSSWALRSSKGTQIAPGSAGYWAAAACNQLGKPLSGTARSIRPQGRHFGKTFVLGSAIL